MGPGVREKGALLLAPTSHIICLTPHSSTSTTQRGHVYTLFLTRKSSVCEPDNPVTKERDSVKHCANET